MSSCASLDNVCPYPIDGSQFRIHVTMENSKNDFAEVSAQVVRPRRNEDFSEEIVQKLLDILKISPSQSENITEIVDKYLSTHVKIVELRLNDEDETTNRVGWIHLFDSYRLDRLNLMRYIRNDDSPDDDSASVSNSASVSDPALSWLFKNRTMRFLKYNTAILGKMRSAPPFKRGPFLCQLSLINLKFIHIDDEDCRSIISNVICPLLHTYENFNKIDEECCACCGDCREDGWACGCCDSGECRYSFILQSICKQHDSIFDWSIEFAIRELLDGPDERLDQAVSLLSFFLRVARNQDDWTLVNNSIARLMRSERAETRSCINWLLSILVEGNGEHLEKLSDQLDKFVEIFPGTSEAVSKLNYWAWRRIARCPVVGSKGYKAIRLLINLCLIELDRILELPQSQTDDLFANRSLATIYLGSVLWLMMPRLKFDNLDPYSTSDQLFEDLKQFTCTNREKILTVLCSKFNTICDFFVKFCNVSVKKSDKVIGIDLAINRASWLLVEHMSSRQLNMLDAYSSIFRRGYGTYSLPSDPTEADYRHYRELVSMMYKHINDPSHQDDLPQRFSCYMEAILSIGPWKRNEEKTQVAESLVVEVHADNPTLGNNSSSIFIHSYLSRFAKERQLRLLYLLRSKKTLRTLCFEYQREISNHTIQTMFQELAGIHSKRMMLVSLCKLLIHELVPLELIPEMFNQFDKLQLAQELRNKQEYSCDQEDLLPTCVELAFPTHFDDPESQFYICEFSYFRDTLDYLERKGRLARIVVSLDDRMRARLEYYQHEYCDFDICCSPVGSNAKSELKFKCLDHGVVFEREPFVSNSRYIIPSESIDADDSFEPRESSEASEAGEADDSFVPQESSGASEAGEADDSFAPQESSEASGASEDDEEDRGTCLLLERPFWRKNTASLS